MRWLIRLVLAVAVLLLAGVAAVYFRYGGGQPFPDRTTAPTLAETALETVADLDWPPGNIAVAPDGRVFFTFHPEAGPPLQVVELVNGEPQAYPRSMPDGLTYQSVLSIRIDRQGRLWVLDNANHGTGSPRILAFDLASGDLTYRFDFPRRIAGIGSHLNDFQVSADGRRVYIADASILALTPALVVLDVEAKVARRLLEDHESVTPEPYVPIVQGRRMQLFGIFTIRPGVDSIALSRDGEWLYFAPVTNSFLYRVRRRDLDDAKLPPEELGARVERFAQKTMSDGITTDDAGNVYLTDADESAILSLDPEGKLTTLLKTPRIRWPDGMGFGPDGWLYFTCSALHQVIGRSRDEIVAEAPYQIFRFRPGPSAIAGH